MEQPRFDYGRFKQALLRVEPSIAAALPKIGCSRRHLTYVTNNQREASRELLERLRALLGRAGYEYATGLRQALPTGRAA